MFTVLKKIVVGIQDSPLKIQWKLNSCAGTFPPGMRHRIDVSLWSHLDSDVADHIETSSRRRY